MSYINFKIASGLMQGVSHKESNAPCEDAVMVVNKSRYKFVGVADGAGYAKHAKEAAEIILHMLPFELELNSNKYLQSNDIAFELTKYIESVIYTYSIVHKVEFNELASTLIGVFIIDELYIQIHVGDGLLIGINENNEINILSEPYHGKFSNYTVFCNTTHQIDRVRVKIGNINDIVNGLLLCSDGIEDSLYDSFEKSVSIVAKEMIDWLDEYSEDEVCKILQHNLQEHFSQLSSDDLSIVIAKGVKDAKL
jgi:serine/threonine protein phosphatase PrpC